MLRNTSKHYDPVGSDYELGIARRGTARHVEVTSELKLCHVSVSHGWTTILS